MSLEQYPLLRQLPRLGGPVKVLQVFNAGKACGWLGHEDGGEYWFHYASGSIEQAAVSVLMPPSRNLYRWPELFPVFEQHLPGPAGCALLQSLYPEVPLGPLELLSLVGANTLGTLTFANPDAPFVQARSWTTEAELARRPLDTLGSAAVPLLSSLNAQGDCAALVYAHRAFNLPSVVAWAGTLAAQTAWLEDLPLRQHSIQTGEHLQWALRADVDVQGLRQPWEAPHSRLGLSRAGFAALKKNPRRWRWVAQELAYLKTA
ncbi:MAG TPA: HipA N-terminal domain-containing protein [Limnobacter sp.]|uniref:HipA N-terminal domain-containing protein n=1 Tax=Limnobacter sp. TaxID=2003368 RepID=UPI002EDAEDB3